jgi:hypothetical protein
VEEKIIGSAEAAIPKSYRKVDLGSDRFLQVITTQCPGSILPMVPPLGVWCFYSKTCCAPSIDRPVNPVSCDDIAKMPSKFFKNRRVYLLTSVAYMGSLLFGKHKFVACSNES